MPVEMKSQYEHWIGGEAVAPSTDEYLPSTSPIDQSEVTRIARGSKADVDVAVAKARAAADDWRERKPIERGRILTAIAASLREHKDELAAIERVETGKTAFQAPLEIEASAQYFEFYGGLVNLYQGEVIDLGPGFHTYTRREPFGVVGVITPWNLPLNQAARASAPALAAGNVVVAKPSEFTSATTVELARLAKDCGLPDGVLNVLLGTGPEVGAAIVEHPGVRKIAFTGSVRAGREIGTIAAERILPVTLELGGKSANIVFDDADVGKAVPGAIRAFTTNAGQVCSAGTRLFVQRSILEPFCEALQAAASQLEPGKHFGPLTTPAQFEKVHDYFRVADDEGLARLTGGSPIENEDGAFHVPVTIYRLESTDSRLAQEEVFGPVLVVLPFDDEEEAVELANGTEYGLAAGLWTQNLSRAHRVAARLEAGQVYVNDWGNPSVEAPFGGYKGSGIGREKGIEALHHYTQLKCVAIKL